MKYSLLELFIILNQMKNNTTLKKKKIILIKEMFNEISISGHIKLKTKVILFDNEDSQRICEYGTSYYDTSYGKDNIFIVHQNFDIWQEHFRNISVYNKKNFIKYMTKYNVLDIFNLYVRIKNENIHTKEMIESLTET
jgi:hypothetical protein